MENRNTNENETNAAPPIACALCRSPLQIERSWTGRDQMRCTNSRCKRVANVLPDPASGQQRNNSV
jgi:hypothetical protein